MTQSATPGNGELVAAADMPSALTAATLVFGDGATQVFTADGHTTNVEQGRPTTGEWSVVSDGKFSSFWPPDYRATYTVLDRRRILAHRAQLHRGRARPALRRPLPTRVSRSMS